MRHWKSLIAGLLLSASAAQQAPAAEMLNEAAVPDVMQRAVDDFIRPGYRAMHEASGKLTSAMERAVCGSIA